MKQRKRYVGLQRKKAKAGILFIMPFILGFLLFMVKPLAQSFYMSFCNVELSAGNYNPIWAGIANYIHAFRVDPEYNRLLTEEIVRMMLYSVAIIVFSFFVSLILNQEFHGRALVRAIFFLPVILSSGVIIGLESNNQLMANLANTIEQTTQGISITAVLENILRTSGVGTRAFEKLFEIIDNIYDVAIASGIPIIIFLSGLQSIPSNMYVCWIYTVVDFSMHSDNAVIEKIQKVMIEQMNYGLASAMSWVYFLLILAFIGITSAVISRGVYYYE